jgi:hypothetical protein
LFGVNYAVYEKDKDDSRDLDVDYDDYQRASGHNLDAFPWLTGSRHALSLVIKVAGDRSFFAESYWRQ